MECGLIDAVSQVEVGASLDQQLGHFGAVVEERRIHQCGRVSVLQCVDFDPCIQQCGDGISMAILGCPMQRP